MSNVDLDLTIQARIDAALAAHVQAYHTTTAPPVNPSGQAMNLDVISGWAPGIFCDFNTDAPIGSFGGPDKVPAAYPFLKVYNDGWPDTAGNPNNGYGRKSTYMPSKVLEVKGGVLRKNLYYADGDVRSAAVVVGGDQLGGRYSVRMRSSANGPGWKHAFLLWPQADRWPQYGELDFPEGRIDGNVEGYVHIQNGAANGSDQKSISTSATFNVWRTYTMEWLPGLRVEYFLDGQSILKVTDRVPTGAMHWVLQTESAMDSPYASPGASGLVEIDWVQTWNRARWSTP